jgi:hypothetical protein
MAEETGLALPLDIPWQLLSRRGPDSAEDRTSLATFVYVPQLPELDAAYPADRLVYFKFTVSVFPFRLDVPNESPFGVFDEAFAPVWRLTLDLRIRSRDTPAPGAFKPYFLSAAPTRRAIIETGVVGDHLTEGESDEVAVGHSGSHLIEGFHSTTKMRKYGGGITFGMGGLAGGFLPMGGILSASYSRGSTSITGGREVSEQLDTTSREASSERRELLSHMTNANNVLTLLNGSLVGTDSLHFSLWPQPLRPLSVDPNDENLWYAELLKRRSSGIEGMQDFYAIAVVPRGEGFCLAESLRRVSVFEPPLPEEPVRPSVMFDNFQFDLFNFLRVFVYLAGKYPQGTPLEELDVSLEDRLRPDPAAVPPFPTTLTKAALKAWYDAVGAVWVPNPLPPFPEGLIALIGWAADAKAVLAKIDEVVKIDAIPRPAVSEWSFSNLLPPAPSMLRLQALTQPPSLPVPYKWVQDVWLEAAWYDYETELAKSPLERGTLLLDDRGLDICVKMDAEGVISDVTTTLPAPRPNTLLPPLSIPPKGIKPRRLDRLTETRAKGRRAVMEWGLLERLLGNAAARPGDAAGHVTFRDPRLVDLFLRRAARLAATDARNQRLANVATRLGFSAAQTKALAAAGVTNLSTLASAILAARDAARLDRARQALGQGARLNRRDPGTLAPELATLLAESIGRSLDASYQTHVPRAPQARRPRPAARAGKR